MLHIHTCPLSLIHKYIAFAHREGVYHRNCLTVKKHQLHFKWLSPSLFIYLPNTLWDEHTHIYAHKYIVLLSLKMKKQMQNRFTQVHNITQIHIHTRPPSYHRAKPSACPMFLLRMFWTSTVRWIPQLCEFVCLCVLFVPWWVGG